MLYSVKLGVAGNGMLHTTKTIDCKTVRIFAYSSTREQSNKRSGTRLKTESETGERRPGLVRLARFARKTPMQRFTDFFTETKTTNVLYSLVGLSTSSEAQCHKRDTLQHLKVMLRETIRKDDFYRNSALQHCFE